MENKKIQLSPVEATVYWWIRTIKEKVREISTNVVYSKSEAKFAKIFINYTEREWRNLYLKLLPYFEDKINNFIGPIYDYERDTFHQDTDITGHDEINKYLNNIIGCKIPDIRLSSYSSKDLVIYTSMNCASIWYKSCGIRDLPTDYKPSYIITGDEVSLDFYNLLITTLAVLEQLNRNFNSIEILKTNFCTQYITNNKFKKKQVYQMFDDNFDKLSNKHIVHVASWSHTYILSINDIDLIGLDEYLEQANILATLILQKQNSSDSEDKQEKQKIIR